MLHIDKCVDVPLPDHRVDATRINTTLAEFESLFERSAGAEPFDMIEILESKKGPQGMPAT